MNVNLLKAELMLRGQTYDDLCKVLNTKKANLYRKLKKETFTLPELKLIQKEYSLNEAQMYKIFFS